MCIFSVVWHRKPFKVRLFGKRKPPSGSPVQQGLMDSGSSSTSKENPAVPAGLHWQDAEAELSPSQLKPMTSKTMCVRNQGSENPGTTRFTILGEFRCINLEKKKQLVCSFNTSFWFKMDFELIEMHTQCAHCVLVIISKRNLCNF